MNDERLNTGQQKIVGYRDLTPDELELINEIKAQGNNLGEAIDVIEQMPGVDKHWLAIARTQLQLGLMALIRAIAKPAGF